MNSFPCDVCGRVATVHDTVTNAEGHSSRHYCREHGLPIWRVALPRTLPGSSGHARRLDDGRLRRPRREGR
ncbi:MAG: hypothetical protein U0794_16740 [Isosphaeraceae bacterium]